MSFRNEFDQNFYGKSCNWSTTDLRRTWTGGVFKAKSLTVNRFLLIFANYPYYIVGSSLCAVSTGLLLTDRTAWLGRVRHFSENYEKWPKSETKKAFGTGPTQRLCGAHVQWTLSMPSNGLLKKKTGSPWKKLNFWAKDHTFPVFFWHHSLIIF